MMEKMTGTIDAPFRLGYLDDKKILLPRTT